MSYEPRVAAALSGATLGQLDYWRRTKVLVPEISADRPILYSFRDLVALRTFAYLRGERSLQAIRRALRTLHTMGATDHLSAYRLVGQGKRSIALVSDDGAVELVEQPGQTMTVVKLGDVLKSFPLDDVEVPNLLAPRERLSVNPLVRGGRPVVSGTRVPFESVADLVRDGVAPDRIGDYYPSVSADAARDSADFADYVDRSAQRRAAISASP
jgi:uncharacterized protein (DUF433 family)